MKTKTINITIVSEKRLISEMLKYYRKRKSNFSSYIPICSLVGRYLTKKKIMCKEDCKFHKETHLHMKKLYPNLYKALNKIRKKGRPAFKVSDRLFSTIDERIRFLKKLKKN